MELLPTRDCETGYGPGRLTFLKRSLSNLLLQTFYSLYIEKENIEITLYFFYIVLPLNTGSRT